MARIPEEELAKLKRDVSLEQLVRTKGIELKKHGKNLIGLCPFHDDKSPSFVVSPEKNLWNCLGACGKGGSVVDFVMKAEGVSFRHAVELLREDQPVTSNKIVKVATTPRLPTLFTGEESDDELLEKVVAHYHDELKQSDAARAYLEKRGLNDEHMLAHFKVGFSERTLGYRMPQKNREAGALLRGRLMQLGVLRESGHEHFRGCVVVPVRDVDGKIVQLYGRRIGALKPDTSPHLYLPRPLAGVFNFEGIKGERDIVLCESIFDALTFYVTGCTHVTTSFGTNGVKPDLIEGLKLAGVTRLCIAFDRDEAGDKGVHELIHDERLKNIAAFRVLFPYGMDANAYALAKPPANDSLSKALMRAEHVGTIGYEAGLRTLSKAPATSTAPTSESMTLAPPGPPTNSERQRKLIVEPIALPAIIEKKSEDVAEAEPLPLAAEEDVAPAAEPEVVDDDEPREISQQNAGEVVISFGDRRYRVRGLEKNMAFDVLRVNLLAAKGDAFHVDTFDVYTARHRALFIKQAAVELAEQESVIKRDVGRVLLQLEEMQDQLINDALRPDEKAYVMSDDEREEAMALLTSPDLVEHILDDFEKVGVVGEEENKLTGYLVAVSRKLAKPLAVMVQSSSAAGKSSLMDAVLSFVPDEEKVAYSAMTGQSLYYMEDGDLRHKVLAIAEEEGAERASYALKMLQSEGRLCIASTGKDPQTGRHVTSEYEVEGPVAIFSTTTAIDVDEELLNRCLVLTVDEGKEQTEAIHAWQRRAETAEGLALLHQREATKKLHQNAQRLLEPVAIVNPFAPWLTFPSHQTRMRRDHQKYLGLMKGVTLLFQHQREKKRGNVGGAVVDYVEVTLKDVELANRLASHVLGRSLDELAPQTRKLLEEAFALVTRRSSAEDKTMSEVRFTRRELREHAGMSATQLHIHLSRLVEMEYVVPSRAQSSRTLEYELLWDGSGRDGRPTFAGLVATDELRHAYERANSGSSSSNSAHIRPKFAPYSGHIPGAEIAAKLNNGEPLRGDDEEARQKTHTGRVRRRAANGSY